MEEKGFVHKFMESPMGMGVVLFLLAIVVAGILWVLPGSPSWGPPVLVGLGITALVISVVLRKY